MTNLFANVAAWLQLIVWVAIVLFVPCVLFVQFFGWIGLTFLSAFSGARSMQAYSQIASRFEPFALPRWHKSAALREFVVGFGRLLPLHKPSPFGDKAMTQKLMVRIGGLTGKITTLLAQAAELAIRQKTEFICLGLLRDAAAASIFKLPAKQEVDDALA